MKFFHFVNYLTKMTKVIEILKRFLGSNYGINGFIPLAITLYYCNLDTHDHNL